MPLIASKSVATSLGNAIIKGVLGKRR